MQLNYIVAGIGGQGTKELYELLVDVLHFDGLIVNGLIMSSNKSKCCSGLEIGFIRTGDGIFSSKIDQKNADAVFLLDLSLIELALEHIKPDSGSIITTDIFHNIRKDFKVARISELLRELSNITENIYICDVSRITHADWLENTDEFKKWTSIFCLISVGLKLGLIPIKVESYLLYTRSILNNEHLLKLNKKILSEIQDYSHKFEG